jgi:hypothetical protein
MYQLFISAGFARRVITVQAMLCRHYVAAENVISNMQLITFFIVGTLR